MGNDAAQPQAFVVEVVVVGVRAKVPSPLAVAGTVLSLVYDGDGLPWDSDGVPTVSLGASLVEVSAQKIDFSGRQIMHKQMIPHESTVS